MVPKSMSMLESVASQPLFASCGEGPPDISQDGEREAFVRNCPHRIPLGLRAINRLPMVPAAPQPGARGRLHLSGQACAAFLTRQMHSRVEL